MRVLSIPAMVLPALMACGEGKNKPIIDVGDCDFIPADFVRPQLIDLGILSKDERANVHVGVRANQENLDLRERSRVFQYIDSIHLDWDEEGDVNTWVVTESIVGTEHETPVNAWVCPDQSVGIQIVTDVLESERAYDDRAIFIGLICDWVVNANNSSLDCCNGFIADKCIADTTTISSIDCEITAEISNAASVWSTTSD